jgi:Copper type II ascorbate-dependent monooxygenase, C-terminal domain
MRLVMKSLRSSVLRSSPRWSCIPALAASLFAVAACSSDDDPATQTGDGDTTGEPTSEGGPTFHGDVAPIFNQKCTGCHQEGGIGPFLLTDYEPARQRASQIASYTSERIMPPFLIETGGECGSFDESVALTEAEIATIGDWAEAGAPEGTPVELAPRPLPVLEGGRDFDLPSFEPQIMGGALAEFDEYRCFPVEHGLTANQYVTGYDVLPGDSTIVHHVLAFIIDPNQMVEGGATNAQVMQALDDDSPDRIGWPCFGMAGDGVEVESVPVIWAPGQGVVNYPDGLGVSFPQDRVLVAQVHYNLADSPVAGATDQTKVRMRLADSVERQGIFLLDDDLLRSLGSDMPRVLPAGQESVVVDWTRRLGDAGIPENLDMELVGLFPHMHGRGRKYTFEVSNGGDFECQGRINRWDFNWQRIYDYTVPVPVNANTEFRVTCDYDTRDATAPVVPGWGTRNEMCFVMAMLGLPPGVFF